MTLAAGQTADLPEGSDWRESSQLAFSLHGCVQIAVMSLDSLSKRNNVVFCMLNLVVFILNIKILYKEDIGTGTTIEKTPEMQRVKRTQDAISSVGKN